MRCVQAVLYFAILVNVKKERRYRGTSNMSFDFINLPIK